MPGPWGRPAQHSRCRRWAFCWRPCWPQVGRNRPRPCDWHRLLPPHLGTCPAAPVPTKDLLPPHFGGGETDKEVGRGCFRELGTPPPHPASFETAPWEACAFLDRTFRAIFSNRPENASVLPKVTQQIHGTADQTYTRALGAPCVHGRGVEGQQAGRRRWGWVPNEPPLPSPPLPSPLLLSLLSLARFVWRMTHRNAAKS